MTIHEIIKKTGFNRRTIYYYTQLGLLPPPRGKGKNFEYSEEHINRLMKIRELQKRRFSLKEIKDILEGTYLIKESADFIMQQKATVFGLEEPVVDESGREKTIIEKKQPVEIWYRWRLAPGIELHFKWPLSEEILHQLEKQWDSIMKRLKEGIE